MRQLQHSLIDAILSEAKAMRQEFGLNQHDIHFHGEWSHDHHSLSLSITELAPNHIHSKYHSQFFSIPKNPQQHHFDQIKPKLLKFYNNIHSDTLKTKPLS